MRDAPKAVIICAWRIKYYQVNYLYVCELDNNLTPSTELTTTVVVVWSISFSYVSVVVLLVADAS